MARSLSELREHLVGEWKFNGDFRDSSGNGNHMTPTDVEWLPTSRGMKPYCNGSSSHITYTDTESFYSDIFRERATVALWAKADGINSIMFRLGFNKSPINIYWTGANLVFYNTINGSWGGLAVISPVPNKSLVHIIATTEYDGTNTTLKLYANGVLIASGTRTGQPDAPSNNLCGLGYDNDIDGYHCGWFDDLRIYSTIFSADEAQLLYESAKHTYGVQPAERSFSHDVGAVLGTPDNAVFCTDMHTKNADGTLIDLSGNSNHGTVVGCGRASGYFRDGITCMSNTGITIPDTDELEQEANTAMHILCKPTELNVLNSLIGKITYYTPGYGMYLYNGRLAYQERDPVARVVKSSADVTINKTHLFSLLRHPDKMSLWADGKLVKEKEKSDLPDTTGIDFYIGRKKYSNDNFIGQINFASFDKSISSHVGLFNKLAALPLYSLDCSKLPANTTEYSTGDFLPNSHIRVNSGEFQIISDAGYNQIKCISSGQLETYNAHEFDGSEYLKLNISDTEYSGTGTITQGTVTASISQGSNEITLNMTAGDVVDCIDIQFREPVE